MKTATHGTIEQAISSFTRNGKKYVFVRHTLQTHEEVRAHYYKEANEYLLVREGIFLVKFGEDQNHLLERLFDLHRKEITLLYFPAGQVHAFIAKSKVSYLLFRDCEDTTVYYV